MKEKIKTVFYDWLPPVLSRVIYRFYNEILFFNYPHKNIFKKNKKLKNVGKGKRAFLLATGPSIKQENLKLLAGEDCFSLSNFYLHDDINIIKPRFHFFAPYHPPLILENYIEWLQSADQYLPKETKIVLGHNSYELVKKHNLFPARRIFYLYLSESPSKNLVDLTRPVLAPQTSPLMILPVLIYMGYEEIYLLGCDHTILRDFKKDIRNFYDEKKDIRKNASDSNVWSNIIDDHKSSMHVFIQYDFYNKLIENNSHSKIINLSNDTWLDVFEKKYLDEVMGNQEKNFSAC